MIAAVAATAVITETGTAHAAFSLTVLGNATFSVTLNGADQTRSYTLPLQVTQTDAGTSGNAGWNLTIASTQFSGAGGATLPTNATSITGVAASCAQGTCTNATNTVAYPLATTAGGATVKFYNASLNTGKGVFNITPTFATAVAANRDATSYTSTLTLTAVKGP